MNGELVADVPAESLVLGGGAPVYEREYREPAYFEEIQEIQSDSYYRAGRSEGGGLSADTTAQYRFQALDL